MYIRTHTDGPKGVDKKLMVTGKYYKTFTESGFDIITHFEHVI